jgi:hypothetical protein
MEFQRSKFTILAVVMEFLQHFHSFILSISSHQVTGTFREEDHADCKDLQSQSSWVSVMEVF